MEQSFLGKLKRVKWTDLLHVFKFLFAILPALILKKRRPDLWLLCDTQKEARDNAYWLFRYIKENEPKQDAVFAIAQDSPDYERVKGLGEIVPYGSFKHWIYYLAASKNISSQKMGKPNAAICYVLEVYGILKNTRIFLQHGVITADLSFLYYEHTKMRMFVTSTKAEWEYVDQHYHYPKGYVQKLGLCRFDALHNMQVKSNQILIMPTWRMYIRNELTSDQEQKRMQQFMETAYYKAWNNLLTDTRFLDLLEKKNLEVVFYPHREMERFLAAFSVSSNRVRIASWPQDDVQTLLKESAMLVTDFSSVAMDFAYMKKPLVYYQFDQKQFRQGHHQIGYFDFERDGFGPVLTQAREVVDYLTKRAEKHFSNEDCYLARHAEYFDLWDTDNCKRNYEAIKAIK